MFGTRPELVHALRTLASGGHIASALLRHVLAAHPGADRNVLVQYLSEAFHFTDGEAYPVFGWLPDGTGELTDERIDYLLGKRIQRTRAAWEGGRVAERSAEPV